MYVGVAAARNSAAYYRGVQMALDRLNAERPHGSRPLGLRMPPEVQTTQVAVAARFRDDPAVIGVVGHTGSAQTMEAAPIYADAANGGRHALVAVTPTATNAQVTRVNRWVFRVCPTDDDAARALAHFAIDSLHLRRVAVVYRNDLFGRGFTRTIAPELSRSNVTIAERDPYLADLRKRVVKVATKSIVKVNPHYDARVMETPSYLTAIFPSGGAFFFDTFTDKPQQVFICTTDPRRDPSTAPGELLNLLVHEEYGHCVHASNSSFGYGAKPSLVDMLWSPLGGAISEGISFQREVEFQDVMEKLQTRKGLNADEKSLVNFYEKHGGFDNIVEEYELYTWMWRIVRFLRIIGDARINSGKQGLVEFIEWASKKTGLSKSMVYHQLFPAHQGNGPGYASTYAIVGESIREIQNRAVRNGKKLLDFNTYACSMGFPARTIFEDRLRAFASN